MASGVSPLEVKIQRILREVPSPLSLVDIHRQLRRSHGAIRPEAIEAAVSHGALFVTVADGRWWLKSRLHELSHAKATELPAKVQAAAGELPLIANVAQARENYVVLDLETTGTQPDKDAILQVVAIRHRAGVPTAMLEEYCSPDGRHLPHALMRKLGFLDRPHTWKRIQESPPFSAISAAVKAFVGDDPVVAYNARFDTEFLKSAFGDFANPVVDAQELAYLVHPELAHHRLADVAVAVGATFSGAAEIARRLAPPGMHYWMLVRPRYTMLSLTPAC